MEPKSTLKLVQPDTGRAHTYQPLPDTVPAAPAKAVPPHLTRKMRLEEALQSIGLYCLRQLEANVPGVQQQDIDSLRRMHAGLCRLQALLDIFEDLARLPAPLRDGMAWLCGELEAARDWDVLAGSTIPDIRGPDLGKLRCIAEQRTGTLLRGLPGTLRDPRYTQLVAQLDGWFQGRLWRKGCKLAKDSPLAVRTHDAMVPLLRKAQRRLRKRIATLEDGDIAQRQRVRVAAGNARHAAEFFGDLLPARRARQYVRAVAGAQHKLEQLNDLAVADRLLGEVQAGAPSPEASYAQGYLSGVGDAESRHLRGALDAVRRLKTPR